MVTKLVTLYLWLKVLTNFLLLQQWKWLVKLIHPICHLLQIFQTTTHYSALKTHLSPFPKFLKQPNYYKTKKTPNHNGISTNFLKKIIFNIAKALHHIFLLSFDKGIVPTQLKIAKVIPIFKTGDRCNMDNYRPISLLSSIF